MRHLIPALLLLTVSLHAATEFPRMGPDIYDIHASGAQQIDAALAKAAQS